MNVTPFLYLYSVLDKLSISLNGSFTTGTVNSEARPALYDVQINHAQSNETKVANLWEFRKLINAVSKADASSKNAWMFVQKTAIDLKIVKSSLMYQIMAETIELIKIEETTNNHGTTLKGLKNAVQSILSVDSRDGK